MESWLVPLRTCNNYYGHKSYSISVCSNLIRKQEICVKSVNSDYLAKFWGDHVIYVGLYV